MRWKIREGDLIFGCELPLEGFGATVYAVQQEGIGITGNCMIWDTAGKS